MIKFIVIPAGKPIRDLAQRYAFNSLTWTLNNQYQGYFKMYN